MKFSTIHRDSCIHVEQSTLLDALSSNVELSRKSHPTKHGKYNVLSIFHEENVLSNTPLAYTKESLVFQVIWLTLAGEWLNRSYLKVFSAQLRARESIKSTYLTFFNYASNYSLKRRNVWKEMLLVGSIHL